MFADSTLFSLYFFVSNTEAFSTIIQKTFKKQWWLHLLPSPPFPFHPSPFLILSLAPFTAPLIRLPSLPIIKIAQLMSLRSSQPRRRPHSSSNSQEESYSLSQNEESYIPRDRHSRRRLPPPQSHKPLPLPAKKYNQSFWGDAQNLAYMQFLVEWGHLFNSDWRQRKTLKINVLMSNYIKTRSPLQCRSHHQKMMKFHGNIPRIIAYLTKLQTRELPEPDHHTPPEEREKERWNETEVILQDLSEKVRWAKEEDQLWASIMCERWIEDY